MGALVYTGCNSVIYRISTRAQVALVALLEVGIESVLWGFSWDISLFVQFLPKMRSEQSKMCMKLKLHYRSSCVYKNYFSDCVPDRELAPARVPLKHTELPCGVRLRG